MFEVNTPIKSVACEICGEQTPMIATKRCDRCWELERRIRADPDIAWRILIRGIGRPVVVKP